LRPDTVPDDMGVGIKLSKAEMAGWTERLAAWREFAQLEADTLTALSGLDLSVTGEVDGFSPCVAMEIGLGAPTERGDLRVIVEMEQDHLSVLGCTMFGEDATDDMLLDMLGEIANTAAGAFARRALADSAVLTMGLPTRVSVDLAREYLSQSDAACVVSLGTSDSSVRLRIHIGTKARESVAA